MAGGVDTFQVVRDYLDKNWQKLNLIEPTNPYFITDPGGVLQDYNQHIRSGGERALYPGDDLYAPLGTPEMACVRGDLYSYVSTDGALISQITFDNGCYFEYVHSSQFIVKYGMVNLGQIIALSGQSGFAAGAHLHWAVIIGQYRCSPDYFLKYWKQKNNLPFTPQEMEQIMSALNLILTKEDQIGAAVGGNTEATKALNAPITGTPDVVNFNSGFVATVVIDNYIYTSFSKDGESWSKFLKDGQCFGRVSSSIVGDKLWQFCLGVNKILYKRSSSDGKKWSEWSIA